MQSMYVIEWAEQGSNLRPLEEDTIYCFECFLDYCGGKLQLKDFDLERRQSPPPWQIGTTCGITDIRGRQTCLSPNENRKFEQIYHPTRTLPTPVGTY